MTQPRSGPAPRYEDEDTISMFAVGSVMLRWRSVIVALGLVGALLGLAIGLATARVYVVTATFIPQTSESEVSGLALAASQFGIRVPAGGGHWGPAVYVDILLSRAFLAAIALDTVVVIEEGGQHVELMDLIAAEKPTPTLRLELAVRNLRKIITVREDRQLGAVRLTVTTRWPSVSFVIAEQMVGNVQEYTIDLRKSQATAERQFVEGRAADTERALREAEERLQSFLERNRVITGSPELQFTHDRLQRQVALRQQIYTSLLQSEEEARIKEVRDTPVITLLEAPQLPAVGESRKLAQKALLGAFAGALLGALIAFLAQRLAGVRDTPSEGAQEFFELLEEVTPRFLKRKRA